ncbi:hypothetical protein [Acinetobacter nectaris]|uniref:hypothetical protein n=1 Tax=Acinetobacter nectaris TaxID=1219382 RepID=UPI001F19C106|nr:hypothetical protein [Acinetobacter nectaris]MCF9045619.1 hypothetical protein [Acinetobacter nectaris]
MSQQQKQQSQFLPWVSLIVGIGCLFAAVFLSLTTKALPNTEKDIEQEDVHPQFQAERVSAMTNLGVLDDDVKPLQQTTRAISSGTHEAEFRGTKFIQRNPYGFTLEILTVGKEEVIRDFLKQRADRDKFIYFRLSNENQPDQYVLDYGLYPNEPQADRGLQNLNLRLPKSLHPVVKPLSSYSSQVNDMGTDELSSDSKLYEVNLTNAPVPRTTSLPNPIQTTTDVLDRTIEPAVSTPKVTIN